jgi:hypothetical protein
VARETVRGDGLRAAAGSVCTRAPSIARAGWLIGCFVSTGRTGRWWRGFVGRIAERLDRWRANSKRSRDTLFSSLPDVSRSPPHHHITTTSPHHTPSSRRVSTRLICGSATAPSLRPPTRHACCAIATHHQHQEQPGGGGGCGHPHAFTHAPSRHSSSRPQRCCARRTRFSMSCTSSLSARRRAARCG